MEANSAQLVYTSVAASLTAQAATNPTVTSTVQKTTTPTSIPTENLSVLPTHVKDSLISSSPSVCDNVAYVSDITIPDGTVVSPGQSFTKTWRVQNTGTCNWTTSYVLGFITGETMEGEATVLTSDVYSGNQIDISVSMVAPTTTGTYVGYWKLQNSAGTSFGETLYVQIKVVESTSTSTPTMTNTPTSTTEVTSTPTSAPVATETPAPTSTPESVPTETIAS
jgi:hypothetical protein